MPLYLPRIIILSFLMIIGPSSLTWASEIPMQPIPTEALQEDLELLREETVSIAVQHEQPISEAPSNVYVVTDEDIRQSGAIDIPTVLRRIPGMEIIQMTGADFDVSVRGNNQLRANKLLVLVDGRSIYLDIQGEVLWKTLPVTLPEIKRIEVLKGPASALYGFNAFDGIINIITKHPDEMPGATVQVGGGEFGTFLSSAVYAGQSKKLHYRLSAGTDQTNQWGNRNSQAFFGYKFNSRFDYELPGESILTASGGWFNSNQYDGPIVDTIRVDQEPSIGYANVGYERPDFFIRAWWTRYTQPSRVPVNNLISNVFSVINRQGTGAFQDIQANSTNIDAQHTLAFGDVHRVTYGINYRHNQASSEFLDGPGREDRVGLYIQDEWKAFETLTAVGGLRFDMDSFINPTYSPRFSLIYKPAPEHSIRAGIAVAFRSPTIFEERTLSLSTSNFGTGVLRGSPQLGPEQVIAYDLGYQGWYLKHRLRARADLFFNHMTDLIGVGLNTGSTSASSFFNGGSASALGGSADIYGGEAGVEFLAFPWLSGFANFSYQEIGQTFGNTNRVKRGAPRFKVSGGLRTDFDNGVSGEAALHYVGSSRYQIDPGFALFAPFAGTSAPDTLVGSYTLVNLRGGYKFWKVNGREKAELAVSLFNTLNDKHQEHPLGEIIGSRVLGWLTIRR